MKKLLAVLAFLVCCITPSFAGSSYGGPTGLVTIPTAESLKYKEFSLGMDYLVGTYVEDDDWKYKLNIGTFENIELGVVGGKTPTEGMYLNIKYYLVADDSRFPLSLAIGAQNLSSKENTNINMVASKKLQQDFGVHFGFKSIFTHDEVKPVVMAGMDFIVDDKLKIISDVDSDGTKYFWNVGAEYFLTQEIALKTSLIDITSSKEESKTQYTIGISYNKFL